MHWKKLHNPDYLGAYSLYDDDMKPTELNVTIKSVSRKSVVGQEGKKDDCIVAELVNCKPMILNATNCKMLTKLFGSPDINAWVGKPFTLYIANIRIAGEATDCLRIRPTLPKTPQAALFQPLPELTPDHEKWEGAKQAIADGKTTIAAILKAYTLSPENQDLLTTQTIAA